MERSVGRPEESVFVVDGSVIKEAVGDEEDSVAIVVEEVNSVERSVISVELGFDVDDRKVGEAVVSVTFSVVILGEEVVSVRRSVDREEEKVASDDGTVLVVEE